VSRGKHLSLEEARNKGLLDQFAKEHPNETDAERFDRLMKAMASGKTPEELGTSGGPASED
jgi:hypothetical protein